MKTLSTSKKRASSLEKLTSTNNLLKLFFLLILGLSLFFSGCDNPSGRYSIKNFGAVGDGETLNTIAIQNAVDECAENGGGIVYFPPGRYLSGTIILRDKVVLNIGKEATLLGSTNLEDYPKINTAYRHYGEVFETQSLIFAENIHETGISGRGTIDGQGGAFKVTTKQKPDRYFNRPFVIRMIGCRDILIKDIKLQNSAMWMQHYLACEDLRITGINVYNHCNQNNDMIDIDGCKNVIISDCRGDTDDDGMTFKSTSPRPCENITVTNCILSSHCNAIKCGTESTGGFKNISISNCVIKPSRDTVPIFGYPGGSSGISLEIVDGGTMDGIAISNITMNGPEVPLFIRLGNRARKHIDEAPQPEVGKVQNITISNIIARNIGSTGGSIMGIPGYPVRNVQLSNLVFEFPGGIDEQISPSDIPELEDKYPEGTMFGKLPGYAFFIRHAENISISDTYFGLLGKDARKPVVWEDVNGLKYD